MSKIDTRKRRLDKKHAAVTIMKSIAHGTLCKEKTA